MPADVLELGKILVRELKLDPGVDTLGRWMAHHIAELIRAADEADDVEERRDRENWASRSQAQTTGSDDLQCFGLLGVGRASSLL